MRKDWGENNLVGVRAAGAGMLLAELIPGEVQGFVKTVFTDAGQALGLGRRAVVRNEAEGLSPADPGPQVECGERMGGRIGSGSIIHVFPHDRLDPSGLRGRPYST